MQMQVRLWSFWLQYINLDFSPRPRRNFKVSLSLKRKVWEKDRSGAIVLRQQDQAAKASKAKAARRRSWWPRYKIEIVKSFGNAVETITWTMLTLSKQRLSFLDLTWVACLRWWLVGLPRLLLFKPRSRFLATFHYMSRPSKQNPVSLWFCGQAVGKIQAANNFYWAFTKSRPWQSRSADKTAISFFLRSLFLSAKYDKTWPWRPI